MTPQASAAVDQPPVAPLSDAELDAESKHLGGDDLNFGSTDEGIRRPWNSPYEVFGDRYEVKKSSLGYVEVGIASWYGQKFQGRKTSNGEIFDMYLASAAHKSLPIPTMVRVTNLDNGRKIEVRVNDRGPFHDDRIIDLSFAAAKALGFSTQGTAPVVVEALDAINYPEKALKQKQAGPKIYLQAGAFQSKVSARNLKRDIEANLMLQRLKAVVRVLESEFEKDSTLHKVWIGPIQTSKNEAAVTRILVQMGLAKPVKVVAN
ncbi:MAG: septal ring lytic transglycosylase RlpA family protein [Gammaproteobacteria bacterium]|nr:septal ring lytic transglycosylase RlpA family protein [Gammaproteobacteria bacterium]MBT5054702.1 septal ring lytic transglycosylase RlpA family protein [Gammaproteobacteria bacterium]